MIASDAQVRDTILGIFEQVRQRPSTPYEGERFLAYLTHPSSSSRRVADTFAGRRRFVRFMNTVQMKLGVCFTLDEWERGFSVDGFVELVTAKMARPGQGLRLARQRLQAARVGQASDPMKVGLLTTPFLVAAVLPTPWPVRIPGALLWISIMGGVIAAGIMDVRYCRELVARIEQVAPSQRPSPHT